MHFVLSIKNCPMITQPYVNLNFNKLLIFFIVKPILKIAFKY